VSVTLLNEFGDCSKHNWLDAVPTLHQPVGRMQGGSLAPCSSKDLKKTGPGLEHELSPGRGGCLSAVLYLL
jgi:hypothetical protein